MNIYIKSTIALSIFTVIAVNSKELSDNEYNEYRGFNPDIADEHPVEFFRRYALLLQMYDEKVIELYSDSAQILGYTKHAHGLKKFAELTGKEWKKSASAAIWMSRNTGDKITYSNANFIKVDNGFRITADRYSVKLCYTDSSFYQIVKFNKEGKLKIIKEYFEVLAESKC
ncbi:hypothetical protein [Gayadomonas joobiniege]|uniref:hypothetical protein n=1 Tax=Gayadomonas joobiniege TaxID=1234606 RepID=UPI00036F715B|nr:hypothetical protein [Gayadomonas joobiniege]